MILNATIAPLLNALIWPCVVLIIAIIAIAVFNKPLTGFLHRSKALKIGKFQMDSEAQQTKKNITVSSLDTATQIFRPETYNFFQGLVKKATNYENLNTDAEKFETLLKYSVTLSIIRRFDMIYSNIYGSQLALLQYVNTEGDKSLEIFHHYYSQAKVNYPAELEHISIESYTNFLYSWELVTNVQNNGVQITTQGMDFLKYLIDSRRDFNLPY